MGTSTFTLQPIQNIIGQPIQSFMRNYWHPSHPSSRSLVIDKYETNILMLIQTECRLSALRRETRTNTLCCRVFKDNLSEWRVFRDNISECRVFKNYLSECRVFKDLLSECRRPNSYQKEDWVKYAKFWRL